MTAESPNRIHLVGYLEEALPPEQMARIEENLRVDPQWRAALDEVRSHTDLGEHSLSMVWRRHKLTCPSREKLGAFLAEALVPSEQQYVRFHLETIGCRWCQANVADLTAHGTPAAAAAHTRRHQRYFESSVGLLPGRPENRRTPREV